VLLTPWQRLALGVLAAVVLTAIGTIGYMVIEGFSFFDALYQTFTTVTTAGFGEVQPMDDAGRLFTMILIGLGIVVILYVLGSVTQIAVEGELEALVGTRRAKARIKKMHDHYIVCGFGRVGEEIARTFTERKAAFVLIDSNPEAVERARRRGYLIVAGDATDESVLNEAGVERARSLLAASESDEGNAYTILTAKSLNPAIFLVARAGHAEDETRMAKAGAHRVYSPYITSAQQMALTAIHPLAVELLEATVKGHEAILAEVDVSASTGLVGATIGGLLRGRSSVRALARQAGDGALEVGPHDDTVLEEGDHLIVIGNESEIEAMGPLPTRAVVPEHAP
jgi:voltage-gated potassium channel